MHGVTMKKLQRSFVAFLNCEELGHNTAADPKYFNFRNHKHLTLIREARLRNRTPHVGQATIFRKTCCLRVQGKHRIQRSYWDSSVGIITRLQPENCGSITRWCNRVRLFPKWPCRVWWTGSILFSWYRREAGGDKEYKAWNWPVISIYWRMCGVITFLLQPL